MEKISSTLKRIPEYKILLSSLAVFIIAFLSIGIYGFLIGGSYLDGVFVFYVICISLVVSVLLCFFMFGKAFFKRFYNKEYRERHIWEFVCLLLIIIQFFFYSSANIIFADEDNVNIHEVEIVKVEDSYLPKAKLPSSASLYFIDSTGELNSVWYEYFYDEDEILPAVGGRVLIKETVGAFNYSVCEFIEVKS